MAAVALLEYLPQGEALENSDLEPSGAPPPTLPPSPTYDCTPPSSPPPRTSPPVAVAARILDKKDGGSCVGSSCLPCRVPFNSAWMETVEPWPPTECPHMPAIARILQAERQSSGDVDVAPSKPPVIVKRMNSLSVDATPRAVRPRVEWQPEMPPAEPPGGPPPPSPLCAPPEEDDDEPTGLHYLCALAGCRQPVYIDGSTGLHYNYCCKTHAQRDGPPHLEQLLERNQCPVQRCPPMKSQT